MHQDRPSSLCARQAGNVLVEFALILPLLLLMALPVYDYASNILAQIILTNAARESANLAKRASDTFSIQRILQSVSDTTPPLDMKLKGYFYITKVIGDRDCDANGKRCSASVVAQYQWQSGRSQTSKIWNNCQDWAVDGSGHCNRLGSDTRVSVLSKSLYYGQIAVIAEAFYIQDPIIGPLHLSAALDFPGLDSKLYAVAIF
jgi:hypothetical protein